LLEAPGDDPNDLPAQRWGVVAPVGEAGDRMLAAVDALIGHRRTQQGAEPKIYRVRPDMDLAAATRWRSEVYRAEDVPEDERPRYLMLLGDLHEVSIELHHVLAGGALDALMRTYRDTNDDLTSRYQRQRAAVARDQPDPEDARQLGRLWMQRNDLRGYVLLGDPAARLGVKPQTAATRDHGSRARGSSACSPPARPTCC